MRSIRRHLMFWVLGALCGGAVFIVAAAFLLTLEEMNEVLDEDLRQMAVLVASYRDLRQLRPQDVSQASPEESVKGEETGLVTLAWQPDGRLLFSSDPTVALPFTREPGLSRRAIDGVEWHRYTVVRRDRVVQVAQPARVRQDMAAESALQLMLPVGLLVVLIGVLLIWALRNGLRPLDLATHKLTSRSAMSTEPIADSDMPPEIRPLVQAMNALLQRLAAAFETQRRFVADAAHELRSPVTALQLQLQLLERSHGGEERQSAMRELQAGIDRSRRLIEQLLQLSRAEPDVEHQADEPVSLRELVESVVGRLSIQAEGRQIDLGADLRADPLVRGDRQQLEALLANLVENALRYTPPGGIVDVTPTFIDRAPALQVTDNGPGIAEAERERVFDRFYRSPSGRGSPLSTGGSGLGLAIVRAIAKRHGATVSLHDAPSGRGLLARVVFPRQQA
jgi:signal transduction histidine kinase